MQLREVPPEVTRPRRGVLPARLPALVRFAFVSFVAIAALGVVLGLALHRAIEQRALDDAIRTARVASAVGIEPHLSAQAMPASLPRAVADDLGAAVRRSPILRVKIFNADGVIVWSDADHLVGRAFPEVEAVRRGLRGELSASRTTFDDAAHATDRELGATLEVYVPFELGSRGGPVRGVAEVYLPYGEVLADVHDVQRQLAIALAAGLTVLWLVLFRLVRVGSRQLQHEVRRNEHLARHDALTGLPNRALLFEEIVARGRGGEPFAVVLIDLDGFKEVNDTLGHHNGDVLLVEIGDRLRACVGPDELVARLGGDEFALLLHVTDQADALERALALTALVGDPVICDSLRLSVGGSAGVAVHPDHGRSPSELLKRADVAMYLAKERRTRAELYQVARDHHSTDRLALAGELKDAIAGDQLFLVYQPKADVRTGDITGVEALVRWRHPAHGVMAPDTFVPVAEHAGLMRALTEDVLAKALRQVRSWWDDGHRLSVAVNLSASNLQDGDLPARVAALLASSQVPPEALVLEITESAIVSDPERAAVVLDQLHEVGVRVAIDDFGTGYSSLAYLQRLTVDELKIDRGFIRDLTSSESDDIIVRATIDLGRNLGLKVVAEGVEDGAAWDRLAELDCDELQGFYLARPIDGAQIPAWVNRHRRSGSRSGAPT